MKKKKSLIVRFPLYFVIRFTHNHEINRQWITDKLGSYDGVDAYAKMLDFVREYNEKTTANKTLEENVLYAKVAQSSDGETCIAICDSFQRRVHDDGPYE